VVPGQQAGALGLVAERLGVVAFEEGEIETLVERLSQVVGSEPLVASDEHSRETEGPFLVDAVGVGEGRLADEGLRRGVQPELVQVVGLTITMIITSTSGRTWLSTAQKASIFTTQVSADDGRWGPVVVLARWEKGWCVEPTPSTTSATISPRLGPVARETLGGAVHGRPGPPRTPRAVATPSLATWSKPASSVGRALHRPRASARNPPVSCVTPRNRDPLPSNPAARAPWRASGALAHRTPSGP